MKMLLSFSALVLTVFLVGCQTKPIEYRQVKKCVNWETQLKYCCTIQYGDDLPIKNYWPMKTCTETGTFLIPQL